MTDADFDYLAKQILQQSSIVLERGKEYLVESRLAPVAKRHGLSGVSELVGRLRDSKSDGLAVDVVEAMVTTETSFFRDLHPFESLRKVILPELIRNRAGERAIRIWCAACSSGQEPYSIAMILREFFPQLSSWSIKLLATDISQTMLDRARSGRFSQIEVNRGLPTPMLLKHFRQEGSTWIIDESLRSMVEFQSLNLCKPWPPLPRMDIVFLRNVMIYFDVETKKTILQRVSQILRPDGYLVLGGAETTLNLHPSFRRLEQVKGGYHRLDPK